MAVIKSQLTGDTVSVTKNTLAQPYLGVTALVSGSGNVANADAIATLTPPTKHIAFLSSLIITGAGATVQKIVMVSVAGLLGGTRVFTYCFGPDPRNPNQSLILNFNPPLPASDINVPIVVTCPAGGSGNTNNTAFAHGYSSTKADPLPVVA